MLGSVPYCYCSNYREVLIVVCYIQRMHICFPIAIIKKGLFFAEYSLNFGHKLCKWIFLIKLLYYFVSYFAFKDQFTYSKSVLASWMYVFQIVV